MGHSTRIRREVTNPGSGMQRIKAGALDAIRRNDLFRIVQGRPNGPLEKQDIRFLPSELPRRTVAAVDVGSSTIKIVVARPDGLVRTAEVPIGFADSIREHGHVTPEAEKAFHRAWAEEVVPYLLQQGVQPENVRAVATAGMRKSGDRTNALGEKENIGVRICKQYGIELIDGAREGQLAFLGTTRLLPADLKAKATVGELGGTSTEIVTQESAVVMDVGSRRSNPFPENAQRLDPNLLAKKREEIRSAVRAAMTPEAIAASDGHRFFIEPSPLFARIHFARTGKDLLSDGNLTRAEIDGYLTEEGLARLYAEASDFGAILATRLAIMAEVMDVLGLATVEYGAEGGLRAGLTAEAMAAQAGRPRQVKEIGWHAE